MQNKLLDIIFSLTSWCLFWGDIEAPFYTLFVESAYLNRFWHSFHAKNQVFCTSIISSISTRVILPSPSRSYMLKAQLSFCSKLPRDVMDRAQMNSLKSIVPSLFLSKVLNACCANFDASP